MLKLFALSLAAVALSQVFRAGNVVLDHVEGYRVEYDDEHNIILLVSERECFIVEAADTVWDPLVRSHAELHNVTVAIVRQINANRGLADITQTAATQAYHSRLEQFECSRKSIYIVSYTPTSA